MFSCPVCNNIEMSDPFVNKCKCNFTTLIKQFNFYIEFGDSFDEWLSIKVDSSGNISHKEANPISIDEDTLEKKVNFYKNLNILRSVLNK